MSSLVFHPTTKDAYDALLKQKPHASLVSGESGSGKFSVAKQLALDFKINKGDLNIFGDDEESSIGVDKVSEIQKLLKHRESNLGVLIKDADRLTVEAQNALLKVLEEPANGTYIFLTSSNNDKLLPTIKSRLAKLSVLNLPNQLAQSLLSDSSLDEETKRKLLVITEGRAGELQELSSDREARQTRLDELAVARLIFESSAYDRLKHFSSYYSDRQKALRLIEDLLLTTKLALNASLQSKTKAKVWLKHSKTLQEAYDAIDKNGQVKLHLDNLSLNLSA